MSKKAKSLSIKPNSQSWTMGSLDDLTPEELGLDDFELNTGVVDEVAETTEPKRNQIR